MTGPSDFLKDTIVVANPGTGKTREIVERVLELLESGVRGEDILCVTFTNKAADEMKTKITREAYKRRGVWEQALRIDISTIHSHASEFLEREGKKPEITSTTILRFIIYNRLVELNTFNYGHDYLVSTIVPRMENAIRYVKSFGIMPNDIDEKAVSEITYRKISGGRASDFSLPAIHTLVRDFKDIFAAYEDFKESSGTLDFNDLLRIFLKRSTGTRKKYVFVDEFQDLNRMQADIVGKLGEKRFFVGDRKQSIFGFQGGSLSSFNEYLDRKGFEVRGKNLNYRSSNNILGFSRSYYLAHSKDQFSRNEVSELTNPEKGDGEKVSLIPSASAPSDSTTLLKSLLEKNENPEAEFAIIARTNSQLESIASVLDESGIKYSSTIINRSNKTQIGEILSYISGLSSEESRVIGKALMTPFSGLTLKEAFTFNRQIVESENPEPAYPEKFQELRSLKFGSSLLERAFSEVIFPVSASIGGDYMSSAVSVLNSAREYLTAFSQYSLEGFLHFMALTGESSEADLRKSTVNLLTVHKAKGLEFDAVIYLPTEPRNSLEYFDAMTSAIIMAAANVDVEADLLEEPLRIDFVAMTRAKDKLYIVANEKILSRFELENDFYSVGSLPGEGNPVRKSRYDEQYMLFVNGRFTEAAALFKESRRWLAREIEKYFLGITRLSYSTISSISDPYKFLIRNILKIRESTPSTEKGVAFHVLAQKYAEGKISMEDVSEDLAPNFDNLGRILQELSGDYSIPPVYNELKLEVPLSSVFDHPGVPEDIILDGRIDAVFRGIHNTGQFLVADYKTSRRMEREHWHQIWLYLRMFQKQYDIEPEHLSGGIMYVNLRETVNTGITNYSLDLREFPRIKTQVVENRLVEILQYHDQPEKFVEKLLSRKPEDEFEERLRENLEDTL